MAKKTIRTIPQARTPMPEQDPQVRVGNFDEVARGYRLRDALVEADRCLDCADQPCVRGCPVGIDIPGFIRQVAGKNFHGAYDVITRTNLLPSVCGRVCPQESQCEGVCTVGESLEPVAIGLSPGRCACVSARGLRRLAGGNSRSTLRVPPSPWACSGPGAP